MEHGMDTDLSPTRAPLLEKPNSPPQTLKQIRRKSSFIYRIDSSEECPSPHDSIYEAYHFTASEESYTRVDQPILLVEIPKIGTRSQNDENQSAFPTVEFRYGHGTLLDTITEKRSHGTIRSLARPRSADSVYNIPFLGHRDSFVVTKSPRRKQSFSVNDVHLINESYHQVCHEIYASPKIPVREPVERPETPPGMPSWTAAQTAPYPSSQRSHRHIPGTPNRVQRFLGIEPSGITLSSRVPSLDTFRVVSAPATMNTSRQAPRFRPPRSAYGPISRHPFNDAPVATVTELGSPIKKVRFTPSATARDSAENNLRNAMESTATSALHPMAPAHPMVVIASTGPTAKKLFKCPHRKRKQAALGGNGTFTNLQARRSQTCSASTLLMSGGRSPGLANGGTGSRSAAFQGGRDGANSVRSEDLIQDDGDEKKSFPCLKCLLEKWTEQAGRLWIRTSSCLCFICCGYDCDDDESTVYGDLTRDTGSGYFDQCTGSRRDVLEQTPASMV